MKPHLAALIDIGGNPLVMLIVVLIVAGIIYMVWSKVAMPLLAQIAAEPWLGIANWIVVLILVLWVLSVVLQILFGISLFGPLHYG